MNNSKKILKSSLLVGSIVSLGGLQANASEMFNFNELGSGSEVRANLLQSERAIESTIELSCGEKSSKKESKSSEAKCGEGKCGEHKAESSSKEESTKESKKATEKKEESKSSEAKCGEGKCGEGKCGGIE